MSSTNKPDGTISQGSAATVGSEIVTEVEASHPEVTSVTVTV